MSPSRGKPEARSNPDIFATTQWSVVLRAQDNSTTAMNTLCEKYRGPLLIWLERRKHTFRPLEPEDLVNGFLASKLAQGFLAGVAPDKGKFRCFVQTCLHNYVVSEFRRIKRIKEGGSNQRLSLDNTNEQGQPLIEPVSADPAADEALDRAWAQTVLDNATYLLEQELTPKGQLPYWQALQPHLYEEAEAPAYAQMAARMSVSTSALYTAACRIRQRLRELILEELSETVASQEDLEEELRHFKSLFGPPRRPGATL